VAEERIRLEIGLVGGQTIGAIVTPQAYESFRSGLGAPDGVVELEAEDGVFLFPVRGIAYAKRWSRESQIGFGRAG